ncbi:TetR/AcrR family transcriptional regulator [Streptosporangium oxazolinicum]|uniref:TetR/AcrR family transcriptional regulator n=1 Tax=Streptosporangium oxazolinicum TaxID=909287 RepID=A0ABP8B6B4_9ACTN
MDHEAVRAQVLDAAERLFYGRGVHGVGMDDIRDASGISLKRLYGLFPAKEHLTEAYLERRVARLRQELIVHVEEYEDPDDRILAIFDWLSSRFTDPAYRGCALINSYGELGATSDAVAGLARRHKEWVRKYLRDLVIAAGLPTGLADQLWILTEGAMVIAGIFGGQEAATQARSAAALLLDATRQAARTRVDHQTAETATGVAGSEMTVSEQGH